MTEFEPHQKGALVLETGHVFEGKLFGAPISASTIQNRAKDRDFGFGEAVFNTSMTGYQEILTDPSYAGQIICLTAAHIGNTGINEEDVESTKLWCSGLVIRELGMSSSWRSEETLHEYLKRSQVPAIAGVDTRALTRILRTQGATRAILLPVEETPQAIELLKSLPSFSKRDFIAQVSTPKMYYWKKPENPRFKVAVLDFGVKFGLLRGLEDRGCELQVFPAKSTAQEILKSKPDGVFLSNGPGNPENSPYAVETVKGLLGKISMFGVCMGHQIIALALGGQTYKLKFGHHGGNQPVFDQELKKVEISSHNHGYSVDRESLPPEAFITHLNLNDQTVEGLENTKLRVFSIQHHPEACPGPHDSGVHFERFIDMMEAHVSEISRTHH